MSTNKDVREVNDSIKGIEPAEGKFVTSHEEDHELLRDERVAEVKRRHEEAKKQRALREEREGFVESEGAKLDREKAEKRELAEANIVYVIEPATSSDPLYLKNKINEILLHMSGGNKDLYKEVHKNSQKTNKDNVAK